MKKLLLIFLTVLTASLVANADVTINSTNFPDANFRNYLLSGDASGVNVGAVDCDGNGSVSIGDVTALINFLLSGSWGNKAMAPAMNAQTQYTASSALTPHELRPLTLKMSQVKERMMRAKLVD